MPITPNSWVAGLEAYTPGEQPSGAGYIKLNTNEAYAPAPEVLSAVHAAANEALFHRYPEPKSKALRAAIAEQLDVTIEEVIMGNGSDEVLRLLCHAYLSANAGDKIGMVDPTYSLYHTLAAMFGCSYTSYPLKSPLYEIPQDAIASDARIFFLANPNPPYGTFYEPDVLAKLAAANPNRLVVIDEAYVDFAPHDAMEIYRKFENVVITRTFSKSYSLAGLRVGFAVARPEITAELEKIRDSYNMNRVSQAGALAAWQAKDYYAQMVNEIRSNREYLQKELANLGFVVPPSAGNFVFARRADAKELYLQLKERKILVRYFSAPALADGIRITIGTRAELDQLLTGIRDLSPMALR